MSRVDISSAHYSNSFKDTLTFLRTNFPQSDFDLKVFIYENDDLYRKDYEIHEAYNKSSPFYNERDGSGTFLTFSFREIPWPGCCAYVLWQSVRLDEKYLYSPKDKLMEQALSILSADYTRLMEGAYHSAIFAYSDEEVYYQHKVMKWLGFEEIIEPFISIKSNNRVRMVELVLASDEAIEYAEHSHEVGDEYY